MSLLNEIFLRLNNAKKDKKTITTIYKEALLSNKPYQDILDALKSVKARKQQMESELKAQMRSELDQIEKLKIHIQNDKSLMTDIALTSMMKGETVELMDENESKYEPVFTASFKRHK